MKNSNYIVSVVVPCYNEAGNIPLITARLQEVLKQYHYEIILVDDGSNDETPGSCEKINLLNNNIHYIRFSRNFGQQAALLAGIKHAVGDAIITIDADLQQPPDLVPEMIERWLAGAEIVDTIPVHVDSVGWFKKHSSYLFYNVLVKLSNSPVVKSANDFRLIDRKVADILKTFPESHLYLREIFSWMGFRHDSIKYRHLKRVNGESQYPLSKLIRLVCAALLL